MKNNSSQNLESERWAIITNLTRKHSLLHYPVLFLSFLLLSCAIHGHSAELSVHNIKPPPQEIQATKKPDQLPQSRIAHGIQDISASWFANPTTRYQHGVLGDRLEAARLMVETRTGNHLQLDLPLSRVFEDLEPRLVDIDNDGHDEIIVVESDTQSGASLALYSITDNQLIKVAATPFLGRANRWLNPLGTGDFDGNGTLDIALVATPHIGGKLRLYQLDGTDLSLFAEYSGVSTHSIGSTELGLGRVVSASPRDLLLVPDQAHKVLMLLEWSKEGWRVIAQTILPGTLKSSLMPLGNNRWRFEVENNRYFEIQLTW